MHYNWLIAFVIFLFVVAVMACIFWNAGCPVIITGDCGLHHGVEDRNHIMVGGQLVAVNRPATAVANGANIVNRPPIVNNTIGQDGNTQPESVTEPFATTVTPCDW